MRYAVVYDLTTVAYRSKSGNDFIYQTGRQVDVYETESEDEAIRSFAEAHEGDSTSEIWVGPEYELVQRAGLGRVDGIERRLAVAEHSQQATTKTLWLIAVTTLVISVSSLIKALF